MMGIRRNRRLVLAALFALVLCGSACSACDPLADLWPNSRPEPRHDATYDVPDHDGHDGGRADEGTGEPEQPSPPAPGTQRCEAAQTTYAKWLRVSPGPLTEHRAVRDSARGRIVMFGGEDGLTWEHEGERWSRVSTSAHPPPVRAHAMAYDRSRQVVVLFGGKRWPEGHALGQTWEYDGRHWRVVPTPPELVARSRHGMAYDPEREAVILHGGIANDGSRLGDTWLYDRDGWAPLETSASPPAGESSLAHHQGRRAVVALTASEGEGAPHFWELRNDWSEITTEGSPSQMGQIAYDPVRNEIVVAQAPLVFAPHRGAVLRVGTRLMEFRNGAWTPLRPDGAPTRRRDETYVYDPDRRVVVMFGGSTPLGPTAETWEFDGSEWTQVFTEHAPSPRVGAELGYDRQRGLVVLFGGAQRECTGCSHAELLGDTWEFDGNDWIERDPATKPPPRTDHALAFDPVRDEVVLFGGDLGEGIRDDATWTYDGDDWTWRLSEQSPPARSRHAMAHVPSVGIVLMGGWLEASAPDSARRHMWLWSGEEWSVRSPAGIPEYGPFSLAWDDVRQRLVLAGGQVGTWEFDGASWNHELSEAETPGGIPVFDAERERMLLVDGGDVWAGVVGAFGRIRAWDQIRKLATGSPLAERASLTYDPSRDRLVVIGGQSRDCYNGCPPPDGGTWEYDRRGFWELADDEKPSPRLSHAITYHAGIDGLFVTGGLREEEADEPLDDTWVRRNGTWYGRPKLPLGRSSHGMVYDSHRDRIVVFGGRLMGGRIPSVPDATTWEYETSWVLKSPEHRPSERYGHAMAYDSCRQKVVLFGGNGQPFQSYRDTWEYDGEDWLRVPTLDRPPAAAAYDGSHSMVYDASAARVVLVTDGTYTHGEIQTWEYDGDDWYQLTTPVPGPEAGTLTYDSIREAVYFYDYNRELWELVRTGRE